jgi:hypothetical protein
MLRAIAIPAFLLGFATLVGIVWGLHSFRAAPASPAKALSSCTTGTFMAVRGQLGPSGQRVIGLVQILPAAPYGEVLLNAMRERLGLPAHPGASLSADEIEQFARVVRYAPVDRTGKFACRSLDPGKYIAVATTQGYMGLDVGVASFDVRAGRGATLDSHRFRPLQAIQ